jgi:hypothetical protein
MRYVGSGKNMLSATESVRVVPFTCPASPKLRGCTLYDVIACLASTTTSMGPEDEKCAMCVKTDGAPVVRVSIVLTGMETPLAVTTNCVLGTAEDGRG